MDKMINIERVEDRGLQVRGVRTAEALHACDHARSWPEAPNLSGPTNLRNLRS